MGKRGSRTRRDAANPNRTTRSAEYSRAAKVQEDSKPVTRAMRRKGRKRVVKERTLNEGERTGTRWMGREEKEGRKVASRVEVGRGRTTERRCGVIKDERNVWSGAGFSCRESTGRGGRREVRVEGGRAYGRGDRRDAGAGAGAGGVWLEAAVEGRKVRREGRSSADDVADAMRDGQEGREGMYGGCRRGREVIER
jgi:hypothetical protein